jgi:hypothetical protein
VPRIPWEKAPPIRGLIPFTAEEIRLAQGTQRKYYQDSHSPCPVCGFSAFNCGHGMTESCSNCKKQGFSTGSPKVIGGECSICGPYACLRKGGRPRLGERAVKNHGHVTMVKEVFYDLPLETL